MVKEKKFNKFSSTKAEFIPYIIFGISSMPFGNSATSVQIHNKEISPIELRDLDYLGRRLEVTTVTSQKKYSLDRLLQNKSIIKSLVNLEDDWNGYGGQPIDQELIERVDKILPQFEIQPQIFPTGRGSIQFDFFKDEDNFLEIEISSEEISVYKKIGDDEEEFKLDYPGLITLANEFNA